MFHRLDQISFHFECQLSNFLQNRKRITELRINLIFDLKNLKHIVNIFNVSKIVYCFWLKASENLGSSLQFCHLYSAHPQHCHKKPAFRHEYRLSQDSLQLHRIISKKSCEPDSASVMIVENEPLFISQPQFIGSQSVFIRNNHTLIWR